MYTCMPTTYVGLTDCRLRFAYLWDWVPSLNPIQTFIQMAVRVSLSLETVVMNPPPAPLVSTLKKTDLVRIYKKAHARLRGTDELDLLPIVETRLIKRCGQRQPAVVPELLRSRRLVSL